MGEAQLSANNGGAGKDQVCVLSIDVKKMTHRLIANLYATTSDRE